MPAVLAAAPAAKQRAELANGNKANVEQTPPPKKKVTKNERPSVLCSTPPTCIKDRDCHVEYTRKEFLGEVYHQRKTRELMVGWFCSLLFGYESAESTIRCQSCRKSIIENTKSQGKGNISLQDNRTNAPS